MTVTTTPPAPTYVNDVQTTTITRRRIEMQLDYPGQMTLGRLRDFVSFATTAGASDDELVVVGLTVAQVLRQPTSTDVSSAPTP